MSKNDLKKIKNIKIPQIMKLPDDGKMIWVIMSRLEKTKVLRKYDVEILKVRQLGSDHEQYIILGESLKESIGEQLKNRVIDWGNINGVVISIRGKYNIDAQINRRTKMCPFCEGRGCERCQETGYKPPVMYDATIRGVIDAVC